MTSGYAGGTTQDPTYEEVSGGDTGHAEVIEVVYDPSVIKFADLLAVFFGSHDPTTLNRQGNDVGTQYRSVIFCQSAEQKAVVTSFISDINASSVHGSPIVTEVADMPKFYSAEEYHQDFAARNRGNQYCEVVINPKLQKVQEHFARLIKDTV